MRSHPGASAGLPPHQGGRAPRVVEEIDATPDLVVEDVDEGFCGAVVGFESGAVVLEDRFGKRRLFPLVPAGFRLDGVPVTLRRPSAPVVAQRTRTASGSTAVVGVTARVARASRIWVEGVHDAALVERIWGDDLRIEGVVVEPLDGIDDLTADVRDFAPGPTRRLGVLVDHLVTGSKESRIVAAVNSPYVLVTGHPYVDIWQAVKPARLGHPAVADRPARPALEGRHLRRAGRRDAAGHVATHPGARRQLPRRRNTADQRDRAPHRLRGGRRRLGRVSRDEGFEMRVSARGRPRIAGEHERRDVQRDRCAVGVAAHAHRLAVVRAAVAAPFVRPDPGEPPWCRRPAGRASP